MKAVVIYFGILLASLACVYGEEKIYYDVKDAPKLYVQYKKDYNKTYPDELSLLVHYEAFKKSLVSINKMNHESTSATFGINKFTDITPEEEKNLYGLIPPSGKVAV